MFRKRGPPHFRAIEDRATQRRTSQVRLSDIEHPGMCAVELQKAIWNRNPKQSFAFLTAYPILRKPFRPEDLLQFIDEMKPGGSTHSKRFFKKLIAEFKSRSVEAKLRPKKKSMLQ